MTMGHWCEFCQMEHSSMTCFHPGRYHLAEVEQEREAARKERDDVEVETVWIERRLNKVLTENRLLYAVAEAAKDSMDVCDWDNDYDPKGCACLVCRQSKLCAALSALEKRDA